VHQRFTTIKIVKSWEDDLFIHMDSIDFQQGTTEKLTGKDKDNEYEYEYEYEIRHHSVDGRYDW